MTLRRIFTVSAIVLGFSLSNPALATVILTSDSVFGAGSVIRDTDNNRDFLRLSETMGLSYAGVTAALGTTYAGWSIAMTADLTALGSAAGLTQSSTDPVQIAFARTLADWFCPIGTCARSSSTHDYVRGLVTDMNENPPFRDAFHIGVRTVLPESVEVRIAGHGGESSILEEVYLVRDSVRVPEPTSLAIFALGLAGLGVMRRRKKMTAVS